MGFSPQQVRAMSPFQYMAVVEGWIAAHDPDDGKTLTGVETETLWQWLQESE